jgi:hypothetical protein
MATGERKCHGIKHRWWWRSPFHTVRVAVRIFPPKNQNQNSSALCCAFTMQASFVCSQTNYYYSNGAYSVERLCGQASSQRKGEAGETKGQGHSGTPKVNAKNLPIQYLKNDLAGYFYKLVKQHYAVGKTSSGQCKSRIQRSDGRCLQWRREVSIL